jgi:hypothetical protein
VTGLETFLDTLGAKKTSKPDEWLMECWVCNAPKLYFNVVKVKGFCVKCWEPRSLEDIAQKTAGINKHQVYQYIADAKLAAMRVTGLKDSILEGLHGTTRSGFRELPEISFPDEYRTLREGQGAINGKQAIAYMQHRGFPVNLLFAMGFGYCATGYYKQRIIIPFYEDGRLVYWQARDYTGKVDRKKKILNPPSWLVTTGKTQVLFNSEAIHHHDIVILTESWGSAMAVGTMSIAINGWHMSERQLELIKESSVETVIILLDPGQEINAWETAKRLSAWKRVYVGLLTDGDPNEVTKSVLYNAVSDAKEYTSSEYLKHMAKFKLLNFTRSGVTSGLA